MKEKRSMRKVMMTTMLVIAGILMIGGTSSKAALQANMTTHNAKGTKTGAQWIEQIRQMETAGQTMGLNETLNTDLSPKTS
ncbi:MAG: hypothetical protein HFJ29_10215, partial [Clostridia bacterium]|nr:hypothetical protein [Clostridia bacterium]